MSPPDGAMRPAHVSASNRAESVGSRTGIGGYVGALAKRVRLALRAPVPWNGTRPFRLYIEACMLVIAAILIAKSFASADTRLMVYVVEVAVVFILGFVVLERDKARDLRSATTTGDVTVAILAVIGDVFANLGVWSATGFRASPNPGFADAILLVLALFILFFGLRSVRPMAAPISLLVALGGITQFISNEDPTFYAYIGRYFVSFTVWLSGGLLGGLGYSVITGPDSFQVLGAAPLRVQVGIRCGGLDVATIYTILIAYFARQTRVGQPLRIIVAGLAAGGALLLNGLRVVLLTVLFLNYPVELVEAFHTNFGDLIFLGYAIGFIVALRRFQ